MIRLAQKRTNLKCLEQKVACLSMVAKTPQVVQELIERNDFISAFELVENAKLVLSTELKEILTYKYAM